MLRRARPEHYAGERAPGPTVGDELAGILTLRAFHERGAGCPTVQVPDPAHAAKNGSLMPLSMARLLLLGSWPVLCMHLVEVQQRFASAGLFVCDVNGSDRMDVGAAIRRLNFAVRAAMLRIAGAFGSIVYLYFMACTATAFFDRAPTTTPRMRCRLAFLNLIFLRYWDAWVTVTGAPRYHFISMQTYVTFVMLDHAVLLLALMYGSIAKLRRRPFALWLFGSNQIEHMLSEWRAFEAGNTTWTLLAVLNIVRRWLFQSRIMASANVHLPSVVSNRGHERSRYDPEGAAKHVHSDYATPTELMQMYRECVAFVQLVLTALGMAQALHDAGMGRSCGGRVVAMWWSKMWWSCGGHVVVT